jgi:uncharacterized membrane protein YgcG
MRFRRILPVFIASFLLLGLLSPLAHADVNDFVINSFDADYTLGTDDPQGTLAIHEELSVDFSDYNHGILRALPKRYNSMPQHVHVSTVTRDGATEDYSTYTSNGNLVLKIGDADKTITGLHHYEIDYKVTNVMRFVGSGAELDWNVNGTEWTQQFLHVTARLHVPASLKGKLSNERCFTGVNGSTQSDCMVSPANGVTTYTTTRTLTAHETLTFNGSVPAGYFKKPTLVDRWDDYGRQIVTALILPVAALLIAGRAWYRHGRDAKGRGTIVPEYGPPADLKPAEIDVLLSNKLGKNAVSATIIDLAIRKYLRIEESESKGVLGIGKHKVYSFVKLPAPTSGTLADYEQKVLDGLFAKGDTVETSDLKNSFYKTLQSVQKSIPKSLAARGFFASNPASAGNGWLIFGGILLFGSFFIIGASIALFIGAITAGLILMIFGVLMPSRTAAGAAAKDSAEGLRLYLNTAEKDRIAMLQSPDAPYAPKTAEPKKTVELFEKLLPYAMVLGVEQQWAKQFEGVYTTPPDWYSGNWSTFNAVYLANSLSASTSAMNSSFAAPSSSSSGSGGSSGGGGGGGGGGGW